MRDDRGAALREIGTLFGAGTFVGLGDGALLDRFVAAHGEAAEAAFAAIVDRHGPMVLRVCKRALKDHNDAEDAFQATFLALLRGAATIRKRDSVASWLHGTALRVSAVARSSGLRRRAHEGRSAAQRAWERPDPGLDDLRAAIVEEVGRLPDRYRLAVVLCDLEGLSHRDAAESLGWPVGTIKSRVTRGRERLKSRLIRRGLAPAIGLIGVASREAVAIVRPSLAEATVALAMGQRSAGVLSSALKLACLYQRSLIMNRIRTVIGVAAFGVLATGATLLAQGRGGAGRGAGGAGAVLSDTYVKSYDVADLVVPKEPPTDPRIIDQIDMSPLRELLFATVAPGTWQVNVENGGNPAAADPNGPRPIGSIIPLHAIVSLAVRHTPEVHEQVAERLEMLRRLIRVREANGERVRDGRTASNPIEKAEGAKVPWFMLDSPTPQADSAAAKEKRAALRRLYEGTVAYKSADFAKAARSLEAGLKLWDKFLRENPGANVDYPDANELWQIRRRYVRALGQLGLPIPEALSSLGLVPIVSEGEDPKRGGAPATAPTGISFLTHGGVAQPPTNDPNAEWIKALSEFIDPIPADWANQTRYRSRAEKIQADEQSAAARKLLDEGTTAYKAANFAQAVEKFEGGLKLRDELLKTHPDYRDESFNRDVKISAVRLAHARRQLGLPDAKAAPFIEAAREAATGTWLAPGPMEMMMKAASGKDPTSPAMPATAGAGGMPGPGGSPAPGGPAGMMPGPGYPGMMSAGGMPGTNPGMKPGTPMPGPGGMKLGTPMPGPGGSPAPGGPAGMMPGAMPGMMSGMSSQPPAATETERRLRAVEEKLDRLLKVLDRPKSE